MSVNLINTHILFIFYGLPIEIIIHTSWNDEPLRVSWSIDCTTITLKL